MKYTFNKIICFFIGHTYKYSVYDKYRRKCKTCNKKQYKINNEWATSIQK